MTRTKSYVSFEVECREELSDEFDGIGNAIESAVSAHIEKHNDLYEGKNRAAFWDCLCFAKWREVANVSEGIITVKEYKV